MGNMAVFGYCELEVWLKPSLRGNCELETVGEREARRFVAALCDDGGGGQLKRKRFKGAISRRNDVVELKGKNTFRVEEKGCGEERWLWAGKSL